MTLTAALFLAGRFLVALLFIIAGVRNFLHLRERFTGKTNYGWSLPPPVITLGFAVQLLGGLSMGLGLWPAYGAAALIVFTILATAFYHNPLIFTGEARNPHIYLVTVNLALCGACLMVIAQS